MSLLKIEKYHNNTNEENTPYSEWKQVDTNPSSIGSLLITIDSLEEGESIKITKL